MECTFKKSGINNLKVLFYLIYFNITFKKKRIKNGGHQTNVLSGEHNLPLPPHILRIIQYKLIWSVLLSFISIYITGRK